MKWVELHWCKAWWVIQLWVNLRFQRDDLVLNWLSVHILPCQLHTFTTEFKHFRKKQVLKWKAASACKIEANCHIVLLVSLVWSGSHALPFLLLGRDCWGGGSILGLTEYRFPYVKCLSLVLIQGTILNLDNANQIISPIVCSKANGICCFVAKKQ